MQTAAAQVAIVASALLLAYYAPVFAVCTAIYYCWTFYPVSYTLCAADVIFFALAGYTTVMPLFEAAGIVGGVLVVLVVVAKTLAAFFLAAFFRTARDRYFAGGAPVIDTRMAPRVRVRRTKLEQALWKLQ